MSQSRMPGRGLGLGEEGGKLGKWGGWGGRGGREVGNSVGYYSKNPEMEHCTVCTGSVEYYGVCGLHPGPKASMKEATHAELAAREMSLSAAAASLAEREMRLAWTLIIVSLTFIVISIHQRCRQSPLRASRPPSPSKRAFMQTGIKRRFSEARLKMSQRLGRRRSKLAADARVLRKRVSSKVDMLRSGVRRRIPPTPGTRLKQHFGHQLSSRLDGRSSVRLQAHATSKLFIDGSRRLQRGQFVSQRSTPALDGRKWARSDPTMEFRETDDMPSDRSPFDRLHVWLTAGEGLPDRPRWWPFEPYVVVTAVGDDTGSTTECPIGAYEFMQRAPYMHAVRPVWDEQGMLIYRRSGTTAFRVTVFGSSRLWSGLYHPRSPAASASSYEWQ